MALKGNSDQIYDNDQIALPPITNLKLDNGHGPD